MSNSHMRNTKFTEKDQARVEPLVVLDQRVLHAKGLSAHK